MPTGDDRARVIVSSNAETPEWSVLGANSLVSTYRDFLESETENTIVEPIAALDTQIRQLEGKIVAVQANIAAMSSDDLPGLADPQAEIQDRLPLVKAASDLPTGGLARLEDNLALLGAACDGVVFTGVSTQRVERATEG
jgi:hypothetical protein